MWVALKVLSNAHCWRENNFVVIVPTKTHKDKVNAPVSNRIGGHTECNWLVVMLIVTRRFLTNIIIISNFPFRIIYPYMS